MKHFFHSILTTLLVSLVCSCTTTSQSRLLTDSLTTVAGAALGNELGDGDPVWAAAGALGGLAVGETINHLQEKKTADAFSDGYQQGRSDAVKQQYWLLVDSHSTNSHEERFSYYDIPVPAHELGGAMLLPSIKTIRIQDQ